MRRRSTLLAAATAALLVRLACTTDDAPSATPTQAPSASPPPAATAPREEPDATGASEQAPGTPPAFTLQLLHASDMDGTVGALDNVEAFSALLDGFRAAFPGQTVVLSSGDNYVRGPRFYAAADAANDPLLGVSGDGRADIALLNAMGFRASAIGNHELDLGTAVFASIVAPEMAEGGPYPGAAFPYLVANLRLTDDEALRRLVVGDGLTAPLGRAAWQGARSSGSAANASAWSVRPRRISLASPSVGGITVEPADSDDLGALAALVQRAVDELLGQGIDKVMLLAHMQQIAVEEALAGLLAGVDIIVAGGSNTILADAGDRLRPGDRAAGDYPLRLTSATGEPLLLANTDADYRYLGRLVVGFDERDVVLPESVDASVSGAYATDAAGVRAVDGGPIEAVSRIVESLRGVLRVRDGNILGRTSVYLAGRRGDVRTQETTLGNLTADANLWLARQTDPEVAVSFKNAGGIRDHIGLVVQPPGTTQPADVAFLPPPANPDAGKREGDISQFNVEGVLRFNNGLAIVPLTARQFVEVVEHAVGFDGPGEVAHGRFPQVGGMRASASTPRRRWGSASAPSRWWTRAAV